MFVGYYQLNVGALFIKGKASQPLMDRCYGSNVVVVTSVPYHCLVALATSTSAALCTYITECTQVGFDSLLQPVLQSIMYGCNVVWDCNWSGRLNHN